MSFLDLHLLIEGTIVVQTPLHVGSGDFKADAQIPRPDADETDQPESARVQTDGVGEHAVQHVHPEQPESARVQTDGVGRPYLPGSSLKGALKTHAEQRGLEAIEILFGEPKDEDSGTAGALAILGAPVSEKCVESKLPLAEELRKNNRCHRAIAARTAVSQQRGTADHKKLFFAERIVPDTHFTFRARYVPPRGEDEATKARDGLLRLLASWQSGGLAMGRGTADGEGRTRLTGLTAKWVRINCDTGELSIQPEPLFVPHPAAINVAGQTITMTLTGDGPYFVQDWTFKPKRNPDEEPSGPQVRALRDHGGQPALPGTSLMGALRSRASWLAAISDGTGDDVIDALFGSTRNKAWLLVDDVTCSDSGTDANMSSVKLDRFSGAPIDGGLFTTRCVADPIFVASLRLRPGCSDKARDFLRDVLLADLTANGLKLGHSGTRGFGWFKVTIRDEMTSGGAS